MLRWLRWVFATITVLFALLFWYMALTVPMVEATAPTVIAIGLSVAVYFIQPKRKTKIKRLEESI